VNTYYDITADLLSLTIWKESEFMVYADNCTNIKVHKISEVEKGRCVSKKKMMQRQGPTS